MNARSTTSAGPKKIALRFSTLILATLFSSCILGFRIVYAGPTGYIFLFWNLFLAWVPFLYALAAEYFHRKKRSVAWYWIFIFLWLMFFPNAPYIITDFVHVSPWASIGVPLWFDVLMIASFAATGLLLGLCSLKIIERITVERLGIVWSWVFTVIVSLLAGFGVYLGRYLRWNSWDLIVSPNELFQDIGERVVQPMVHSYTWFVSVVFGALIIFLYLGFSRFCDYHRSRRA